MARALELAQSGRGSVEPNPMVGAVIVRGGQVVAEGCHARFGGPHAEVEAIAQAQARGQDLSGSTLYVTLEPCCHQGKTPPCTDAIIRCGFARVVAAMEDPDQKVSGRGLAILRRAGMELALGVLEGPARELLGAYIKTRRLGRPWVICKWAQSLDGRIATHTGQSRWITGPQARAEVHRVRSWCDGVCVGVGTVLADDPLLTNRSGSGKQPARVVLDAHLRIPLESRLVQSARQSPLLIVTAADPGQRLQALEQAGAQVLRLPASPTGGADLPSLLEELGRRGWTYLLVEGGRNVLGQFLSAGLADEAMVFVAPRLLGGRQALGPVDWPEPDRIDQGLKLPPPRVAQLGEDLLLNFVISHY